MKKWSSSTHQIRAERPQSTCHRLMFSQFQTDGPTDTQEI